MSPLDVQFAAVCLDRLRDTPQATDAMNALAREQGISPAMCAQVVARLEAAGLIVRTQADVWEIKNAEVTALEVLQALWGPALPPEFRAMYGTRRGSSRHTKVWSKQQWPNG
jgi:DNA-binding Lrp family transcriptional regulator